MITLSIVRVGILRRIEQPLTSFGAISRSDLFSDIGSTGGDVGFADVESPADLGGGGSPPNLRHTHLSDPSLRMGETELKGFGQSPCSSIGVPNSFLEACSPDPNCHGTT